MIDKNILTSQTIKPIRQNRLLSQYIIKYKFQLKFSLLLTTLIAIGLGLLWLESKVIIDHYVAEKMIPNDEFSANLVLLPAVLGKSVIFIIAVGFGIVLFISHFIAGPIFRIEKTLEGIRDGNLSMLVRFRKRDPFSETAEIFNQALSSLRLRLRKQYDSIELIQTKSKKLVETLRGKGCQDEAAEIEQLVSKLIETTDRIKIS